MARGLRKSCHICLMYFLLPNFHFTIWPHMTWLWPFMASDCQNGFYYRITRVKQPIKHMSHDFRRPLAISDLLWPDIDLDLCLKFHYCLMHGFHYTFESTLCSISYSLRLWIDNMAQKLKYLHFDLLPALDLTCDLISKTSLKLWVRINETFRLPYCVSRYGYWFRR